MDEMQEAEAIAALDALNDNQYDDHIKADEILLAVLRSKGLGMVAAAYERARKRVTFWYS